MATKYIIKKETIDAWVEAPYDPTRLYTEWQQLAYRFPDQATAEANLCPMEIVQEVDI